MANASATRLDVADVLCHICLSILIEPVTMPCQHRICKICFKRNLEINSLLCPMCKKRIGTWARRKKDHELVDHQLWNEIQRQFPERVQNKLAGVEEDAEDLEDLFPCVPTHQYMDRGTIKAEFEAELLKMDEEREAKEREDEALSLELIGQLKEEEQVTPEVTTSPTRSTQRKSDQPTLDAFIHAQPKLSNQADGMHPNHDLPSGSSGIRIAHGDGIPEELLREHLDALAQMERLKEDEALAKSLYDREVKAHTPRSLRSEQLKRRSTTSPSSPSASKKMRQLSLVESFKTKT